MTTIRAVVADDDERVRSDFRQLLELEPDIEVVATVGDGAAALDVCRQLLPDVVVMDVRMPVLDGIEATRRLRSEHTDRCRVLVVTTFDVDEYVLGAARAGASGFVVKDQAVAQLADGVRIVARGDALVSPRATARLLQAFVPAGPEATAPTVGPLSERETEVVRLLARGLSNEEIAQRAFVSRATVKSHVSSVLTKLGLTSRIQVVVWAYEHGLAAPPP